MSARVFAAVDDVADALGVDVEVLDAILDGSLPTPELCWLWPSGLGTCVGRTKEWLADWRRCEADIARFGVSAVQDAEMKDRYGKGAQ